MRRSSVWQAAKRDVTPLSDLLRRQIFDADRQAILEFRMDIRDRTPIALPTGGRRNRDLRVTKQPSDRFYRGIARRTDYRNAYHLDLSSINKGCKKTRRKGPTFRGKSGYDKRVLTAARPQDDTSTVRCLQADGP